MNTLKAESAAHRFKIEVVRLRQGFGKRHVCARTNLYRSIPGDDAFTQGCEPNRQLDGGTRSRALGESQLLVHHRQNASTGRIDRDHGPIHVAQGIDSSLAHNGIFTRCDITRGQIVSSEGVRCEALIITTMATDATLSRVLHPTAVTQSADLGLSLVRFVYFARSALGSGISSGGDFGGKRRSGAYEKDDDDSKIPVGLTLLHSIPKRRLFAPEPATLTAFSTTLVLGSIGFADVK